MRKKTALHTASGIVIFYPSRSLAAQIHDWAERRGGCRVAFSFERTLPGIRRWLRKAEFALINATDDPAQASDAFLQSVGVLRAGSVAVYTEINHDGLEPLVRSLGAPLVLGPMNVNEWDEFLECKFPSLIPLSAGTPLHKYYDGTTGGTPDNLDNNIVTYKPIAG